MLSEGAKEHLQPKKHLCSSLTGAHKKDVLLLGFWLFGFWPYISLHKGKNSKWDAVQEPLSLGCFWADALLTVSGPEASGVGSDSA